MTALTFSAAPSATVSTPLMLPVAPRQRPLTGRLLDSIFEREPDHRQRPDEWEDRWEIARDWEGGEHHG